MNWNIFNYNLFLWLGNVSARVKDSDFDQRERPDFIRSKPPYLLLKSRAYTVVFQTEPLEEAVQVIGPIKVRLFVPVLLLIQIVFPLFL